MKTKEKKQFYKHWWFWAIIVTVYVVGGIGVLLENKSAEHEPTTAIVKTDEEEKVEKELEKRRRKKRSNKRKKKKGEIAVFQGKVIQVSESILDNVVYRVNINNTEDKWSDTIYVTYKRSEGEARILEDDIVTIYGDLKGIETYTSVLGGKISIPAIKAKYINIE